MTPRYIVTNNAEMEEHPNGDWVTFKDYDAVEKRLQAASTGAEVALGNARHVMAMCCAALVGDSPRDAKDWALSLIYKWTEAYDSAKKQI